MQGKNTSLPINIMNSRIRAIINQLLVCLSIAECIPHVTLMTRQIPQIINKYVFPIVTPRKLFRLILSLFEV